jgi:hypothetical protein
MCRPNRFGDWLRSAISVGLLHFLRGSEDEALSAVWLCEKHLSPKPVHKKTTPLRGPFQPGVPASMLEE